jgi:hypothetical protein
MREDITGQGERRRAERNALKRDKAAAAAGYEIGHKVLVRITYNPRYARQSRDLLRRPLRIAACNQNPRAGIFAMDLSYSGACVMICRRCDRAGVQDYNICMGHRFSPCKSPGAELLLNGGTVRLGGATAKILHDESGHRSIIIGVSQACCAAAYNVQSCCLHPTEAPEALFCRELP